MDSVSDGDFSSQFERSWWPTDFPTDQIQDATNGKQLREEEAEDDAARSGDILGLESADRLTVKTLPYGEFAVGIEFKRESMTLLAVAVALEVARWPGRPLRAEVIAAGICLAVAKARRERNVKHPRDMAKDVRVRPKTMFAIMNFASQEIQRLNLEEEVMVRTFENGNL
jgi:hypothetical protein